MKVQPQNLFIGVLYLMLDVDSVLYGELLINNNGIKLNNSNYKINWTTKGAILAFKGLGQEPIS